MGGEKATGWPAMSGALHPKDRNEVEDTLACCGEPRRAYKGAPPTLRTRDQLEEKIIAP